MSNAGRIAVVAVIAAVAFGAAFLLTGGGDDESSAPTDLAAGGASSTTEAPSSRAASGASGDGGNPCRVDEVVPVAEAGYEVSVATEPDPPTPQGTTFEVVVQREGVPVSGATVCLSAGMSEMSHTGVSAQAEELGEGRYQLALNFGMRGSWSGGVLVIESGQGASMPVSFNVQ